MVSSGRRPATGLIVTRTGKNPCYYSCCSRLALRIILYCERRRNNKEGMRKIVNIKYSYMAGSRQHLTCSFITCLLALSPSGRHGRAAAICTCCCCYYGFVAVLRLVVLLLVLPLCTKKLKKRRRQRKREHASTKKV